MKNSHSSYPKLLTGIILLALAGLFLLSNSCQNSSVPPLILNEKEYFETRGVNVLVFSNWYNSNFSDSKMSGIEMIHHGVRTVTNGDVRLGPTPEQWDPVPRFVERRVLAEEETIEATLSYDEFEFEYVIRARAENDGVWLSVELDSPLPAELEGIAGFNLEFLPSAYFSKGYLMDGRNGTFPLYPGGPMEFDASGKTIPKSLASGHTLALAPEDPAKHIIISSDENELSLYDGRNKAQNGWFVVRSLIPSGKAGTVISWFVKANSIPGWVRTPVIAHSQLGYHPEQEKLAVIELDPNDNPLNDCKLLAVNQYGEYSEIFSDRLNNWGEYLRYNYFQFDFSEVREPGLYLIEYGKQRTLPFRIAEDIYKDAWHIRQMIFFYLSRWTICMLMKLTGSGTVPAIWTMHCRLR